MEHSIGLYTTWGTPVTTQTEYGYKPVEYEWNELIKKMEDKLWVRIAYYPLFQIDSSDFLPQYYIDLAASLTRSYWEHTWHVIIHWSDTLAFTSSIMSYVLSGFTSPFLLTWAMKSAKENPGEFFSNLELSLLAAQDPLLQWSLVGFNQKVFLWNRITKVNSHAEDAFESPHFPLLGRSIDNKLITNTDLVKRISAWLKNNLDEPVISLWTVEVVRVIPGFNEEILDFYAKKGVKWIIIEGFWDGNTPTFQRFQKKVENLASKGVVIVLLSPCLYGNATWNYEGAKLAVNSWAIMWWRLTLEAAVGKLRVLLGKYPDKPDLIKQRMWQDRQCDLIQLTDDSEQ